MVYYKREDSSEWKGPAKVLGQGGPFLFLRQGTRYIKAHVCRVQSIKSHSIQYTTPENSHNTSNTHNIDQQDKTIASFKTNENSNESSDEESTTSISNIEKQTDVRDNTTKSVSIVCTPLPLPPFLLGGLSLLPNFQKGGLDRISIFRGGCWEREGYLLFRGGLQFFHKK